MSAGFELEGRCEKLVKCFGGTGKVGIIVAILRVASISRASCAQSSLVRFICSGLSEWFMVLSADETAPSSCSIVSKSVVFPIRCSWAFVFEEKDGGGLSDATFGLWASLLARLF